MSRAAEIHTSARRQKGVRAVDLKIPLLRQWQHELATRSAAAAPHRREPRFLVTFGQAANDPFGRALIRVSFTRVSARFAWPSAELLEGRYWT
jgi:hypothetical protein